VACARPWKQVKRAFRKQALKLHPDVNKAPDAAERFNEIKAARPLNPKP
jgi:molecular chaperone DnaJ